MKINSIILIDEDEDDCNFFKEACQRLKVEHKIVIFKHAFEAYDYLNSVNDQPLFIICDINLPLMNGIDLRQKINANEKLRVLAIPFIFWSTTGSEFIINKPSALNIQGFFKKPASIKELEAIISSIIIYWSFSYRPQT